MALEPVAPREREPILDALRGFAILGILLVNIEVMRGPGWLLLVAGGSVAPESFGERLVPFVIGWFGTGKFLSSLAILLGVGAALIAERSLAARRSPRSVLARRYAWLMLFGLAHMLLYPGDILFLYGLPGFALLPFVRMSAAAVFFWSFAIFTAYTLSVFGLLATAPAYAAPPAPELFGTLPRELAASAVAAFSSGSWNEIFTAHVSQAQLLQALQLSALPWILALFLFGFAVARAGLLANLDGHREALARGAAVGLGLGLPLNFALGFDGPLSGWGSPAPGEPAWITAWGDLGQLVGEPVLAVGYLCALTLSCMRRGAIRPLAVVGRMALTAYILQSALALAVFGGLGLYDRLTTTSAMLVVAAIWTVVLVFCGVWLRHFRMGPVEWLWRSLTYARLQPIRARAR